MYLGVTFLLLLSILLLIGNLIADLLLAWIDPRVRLD
jgi:peptide/nickel transport system permease protein